MTAAPARASRVPFAERRPLIFALGVAAVVLALTTDERVFGLLTDGQVMTRTAYSMAALREIGIARGHAVDVVRPLGDAVTRYGMGPSLARVPAAALAEPFEKAFGPGSSQTLFVLEQVLFVLLAAAAAGLLARAFGAEPRGVRRATLAAAIASPLWAYAGSDWGEPLLAACVGGAFACAALAGGVEARRGSLLAAAAGACAGLALLSKSLLVVLLPAVLIAVALEAPAARRMARVLACLAGTAPFALIWLAFDVVRFGRPFAAYPGEHFSHPVLDGLWRLLVGPNKGLIFYFPLVVLSVIGLVALTGRRRALALVTSAFAAFLLGASAAWWSWDGTSGWGPRLLVPLVPLLAALAALGAATAPRPLWTALFAAGVAVNALGALQPDAVLTWYYTVLEPRPLDAKERERFPEFATVRDARGEVRLLPIHDAAMHAGLSPLRVNAWLLAKRLAGGDVLAALTTPPWHTDRPGQHVALTVAQAVPASARVFLTSPFRWPHLGMSLGGPPRADTVLAWVDCLYDQALRAQDTGRTDRAVAFAEELYARVPSAQTAATLAEACRLAGRRETLADFVRSLPPAQKASPDFGLMLAFAARDAGDEARARFVVDQVRAAAPSPDTEQLLATPVVNWPAGIRALRYPPPAGPRR